MIVFICPIRHPHNSKDYSKVENLLQRTLVSVCRQTDTSFRVVVVCNQIPKFATQFDKVDFLKVDFSPLKRERGVKPSAENVHKDKGTKYFSGLLHAKRKYNPEYVMFFDGDDLVSNRVAEYVNSHPGENGWFFRDGYVYADGIMYLMRKKNFHLACGTCNIISSKLLKIPEDFPQAPSQEQILSNPESRRVFDIIKGHADIQPLFERMGKPLLPLPFPGAIWVVNHGENDSVNKGISALIGSPISRENCDEFALDLKQFSIIEHMLYLMKWPSAILISLRLFIFRDMYHKSRKKLKYFILSIMHQGNLS
ncbi:MAG: glycosyltransferase family A protein [Cyanobacteria bacterium P01_A01_bin.123]